MPILHLFRWYMLTSPFPFLTLSIPMYFLWLLLLKILLIFINFWLHWFSLLYICFLFHRFLLFNIFFLFYPSLGIICYFFLTSWSTRLDYGIRFSSFLMLACKMISFLLITRLAASHKVWDHIFTQFKIFSHFILIYALSHGLFKL